MGKNLLGQISEGAVLKLSGLIMQGHLRLLDDSFARVYLEDGEELGPYEIEDEDISEHPWCMLIAKRAEHRSGKPEKSGGSSVLLLKEVEGKDSTFRRVGILNRAPMLEHWKDVERKVINLI